MRYSLFPFPSIKEAGGPDICGQLRIRRQGYHRQSPGLSNLELLETTVQVLREVPWQIRVDYCVEENGDLQLAVAAVDLGRDIDKGDQVKAGFFLQNSESATTGAFASERLYRVVCENGLLVECEPGQVVQISRDTDWQTDLSRVIDRCFAAPGLDRDAARFRATTNEMLLTPYELLCHLVAQNVITDEEHCAIQQEFDRAGDSTLYGLINAVTRLAGRLRDFDEWKRSMELERLGGEILRGDHQPPILDPVYH